MISPKNKNCFSSKIYKIFCYLIIATSIKYLDSIHLRNDDTSIQWAFTLSLNDGCFQAYILNNLRILAPHTLNIYLKILVYNLGCFPLEYKSYHLHSDYLFNSILKLKVLLYLVRHGDPPHTMSALP